MLNGAKATKKLLNVLDSAKKPQTNADRIRSMTDEELEDGIRKLRLGYEPWCDYHCKMQGEGNCNICLKDWLKQPAEGE